MSEDSLIRMSEMSIKCMKRSLRTNYGLFSLSLFLFMLNAGFIVFGVSSKPWLTGIAVGVTGMNCLWMWLLISEMRIDLKLEKEKLAWLERRHEYSNS